MLRDELLVELVRPTSAFRAVQRRLVEERGIDRRAKKRCETLIIGLMRQFDKSVGGLRIEIITNRIAIHETNERHQLPVTGRCGPVDASLVHRIGQLDTLSRCVIDRDQRH